MFGAKLIVDLCEVFQAIAKFLALMYSYLNISISKNIVPDEIKGREIHHSFPMNLFQVRLYCMFSTLFKIYFKKKKTLFFKDAPFIFQRSYYSLVVRWCLSWICCKLHLINMYGTSSLALPPAVCKELSYLSQRSVQKLEEKHYKIPKGKTCLGKDLKTFQ